MFMRRFSLDEALQYAIEAKDYARDQIRKGSTQLENNVLSNEYFDYLETGVGDELGTRGLAKQQATRKIDSDPLDKNELSSYYESMISTTSKFSIGNCTELAIQALDYVLSHLFSSNIKINAEVYLISGGDHVFLVLNRDPWSNPQDPKTWGENAVICDPWANKVFKASDYLSELKNFHRVNRKNSVEDFNPSKHVLVPYPNFNTNSLCYARNIDNLKVNFLTESNKIIKILLYYHDELSKENNRIIKKYSQQDQRVHIISAKMTLVNKAIRSIKDVANMHIEKKYKNDYRFAKSELMKGLNALNKNAVLAMQFSQEDQSKLFEHKGEDAKTEAMKLFGYKSDTQSQLENLTKKINVKLSRK